MTIEYLLKFIPLLDRTSIPMRSRIHGIARHLGTIYNTRDHLARANVESVTTMRDFPCVERRSVQRRRRKGESELELMKINRVEIISLN